MVVYARPHRAYYAIGNYRVISTDKSVFLPFRQQNKLSRLISSLKLVYIKSFV